MTDFIVTAVIAAAVISVVIYKIKKKKSGDLSCGCGCEGCSSSAACDTKRS